jgi:hypothetical protein
MNYLQRLKNKNADFENTAILGTVITAKSPSSPAYGGFGSSDTGDFQKFVPLAPMQFPATDSAIDDDRRHCKQCLNFRNGYCIRERCRPLDDIPRRCDGFRAGTETEPRYFQFLITRQDGSQFYSTSVPFMSLREIRIQHYNAMAIEPVR